MDIKIAIQTLINNNTGIDAVFAGCPTNSCMALMHIFLRDVLGITDVNALAQAYAYLLWSNYPNYEGANYFSWVDNTPTNVPTPGSLIVWKNNEQSGIPLGHVAVYVIGDANSFTSFDADFPYGTQPHLQTHSYDDVAGWLVPNNTVPNYNALFLQSPTPSAPAPAQSASLPANQQTSDPAPAQPTPLAISFGNAVNKSKNFDAIAQYLGYNQTQAIDLNTGPQIVSYIQNLQQENQRLAGQVNTLVKAQAPAPNVNDNSASVAVAPTVVNSPVPTAGQKPASQAGIPATKRIAPKPVPPKTATFANGKAPVDPNAKPAFTVEKPAGKGFFASVASIFRILFT